MGASIGNIFTLVLKGFVVLIVTAAFLACMNERDQGLWYFGLLIIF